MWDVPHIQNTATRIRRSNHTPENVACLSALLSLLRQRVCLRWRVVLIDSAQVRTVGSDGRSGPCLADLRKPGAKRTLLTGLKEAPFVLLRDAEQGWVFVSLLHPQPGRMTILVELGRIDHDYAISDIYYLVDLEAICLTACVHATLFRGGLVPVSR